MFESLMKKERTQSGLAQPVLALAVHVGLILAAIGGTSARPPRLIVRDGGPDRWVSVLPPPREPGTTRRYSTDGLRDHSTPRVDRAPVFNGPLPGPIDVTPVVLGPIDPRQLRRTAYTPDSTSQPGMLDSVVQASDLSEPPVILHLVEPRYPEPLREAGIEGVVSVIYVVDARGNVEPSSITFVSTDHPALAESVRNSLIGAKFQPGRLRGKPVRTLVSQVIRFSALR